MPSSVCHLVLLSCLVGFVVADGWLIVLDGETPVLRKCLVSSTNVTQVATASISLTGGSGGGSRQFPLFISGGTIKTAGYASNERGAEYDASTLQRVGNHTFQINLSGFSDGTLSDGTHDGTNAWFTTFGGTVYRLNMTDLTLLDSKAAFVATGYNSIAYDPKNNTLWMKKRNFLAEFSKNGTRLQLVNLTSSAVTWSNDDWNLAFDSATRNLYWSERAGNPRFFAYNVDTGATNILPSNLPLSRSFSTSEFWDTIAATTGTTGVRTTGTTAAQTTGTTAARTTGTTAAQTTGTTAARTTGTTAASTTGTTAVRTTGAPTTAASTTGVHNAGTTGVANAGTTGLPDGWSTSVPDTCDTNDDCATGYTCEAYGGSFYCVMIEEGAATALTATVAAFWGVLLAVVVILFASN